MAEYKDLKVDQDPAENGHLALRKGDLADLEKQLDGWCAVSASSALPRNTWEGRDRETERRK